MFDDTTPPAPGTGTHDVEVAARIAPLREALAFEREDAHQSRVVLDDVDDILGVDVHHRRADQLRRPDLQELSLLVEYLHAVVLAVGDEHPTLAVYPYPVRQVELPRSRARLAPRHDERAV